MRLVRAREPSGYCTSSVHGCPWSGLYSDKDTVYRDKEGHLVRHRQISKRRDGRPARGAVELPCGVLELCEFGIRYWGGTRYDHMREGVGVGRESGSVHTTIGEGVGVGRESVRECAYDHEPRVSQGTSGRRRRAAVGARGCMHQAWLYRYLHRYRCIDTNSKNSGVHHSTATCTATYAISVRANTVVVRP
jgi:hypothetical protein